MLLPIVALVMLSGPTGAADVGPLVRALWLVQTYGTPEALGPENDRRAKGLLSKALAKDGVITLPDLGGLMAPDVFSKLAGPDAKLDQDEVSRSLDASNPESRARLASRLHEHTDYLTTTLDRIDGPHREAVEEFARWIASNYSPGNPLHVIVVCTGNSRRSFLGSSMGNLAAAYYGMPEVRFHSGGTAPSAFNARTIAALRSIGFGVEP